MDSRNAYDDWAIDKLIDTMSCSQWLISSDIATRSNCVWKSRSGFCPENWRRFWTLLASKTRHAWNSQDFGAFVFETNELIDDGRPSPAQHTEPATKIERSRTRVDASEWHDHFAEHAAHVHGSYNTAKVEMGEMD